jgi:hypothetical protein
MNKKIILVFFTFVTVMLLFSQSRALINIASTFLNMLGNDIYNVGNLNSTGNINNTGTIYGATINATGTISGGNANSFNWINGTNINASNWLNSTNFFSSNIDAGAGGINSTTWVNASYIIANNVPILLCTSTLSGPTGSISCSSLPAYSTYHIIVYISNVSAAGNTYLRFNGDSTAGHYTYDACIGSSTTCSSSASAAQIQLETANLMQAKIFNCYVYNSLTASTDTMVTCTEGKAGATAPNNIGGLWNQVTQINSITILASTGNLNAGTVLKVYGE